TNFCTGRKRTLVSAVFRVIERPLSGKADIQGTAQNFHKIDQLGTSALPSEADIQLDLLQRAANDPKRTLERSFALGIHTSTA
ncbi:MAG: hypothetical protein V3T31_07910, partial [candidate division Zixibacteria bacterium]